ncbi:MAG: hypothetical protein O3A91_10030, partial [Proteobacteria bacterium]|nr:hypothetical protein [Pseudomonadota bacterium]
MDSNQNRTAALHPLVATAAVSLIVLSAPGGGDHTSPWRHHVSGPDVRCARCEAGAQAGGEESGAPISAGARAATSVRVRAGGV